MHPVRLWRRSSRELNATLGLVPLPRSSPEALCADRWPWPLGLLVPNELPCAEATPCAPDPATGGETESTRPDRPEKRPDESNKNPQEAAPQMSGSGRSPLPRSGSQVPGKVEQEDFNRMRSVLSDEDRRQIISPDTSLFLCSVAAEAAGLANRWAVEAVDGVLGVVQCTAQAGQRRVAEPRILALFLGGGTVGRHFADHNHFYM